MHVWCVRSFGVMRTRFLEPLLPQILAYMNGLETQEKLDASRNHGNMLSSNHVI